MEDFFSRLLVFQVVIDIIRVTIGTGLCFGALKWRKGLLTTTALLWGLFLGLLASVILGNSTGDYSLIYIVIGAIVFPILTYTVPGVNRFVLGFLVSYKLTLMLTTVLAKAGDMEFGDAIVVPVVVGAVVGFFLMAWTRMRVSAFVLSCSFLGASEIAPVVSEWANRILYSTTGDYRFLFDPIDIMFALLRIELTDTWMLITMIVFMTWGGYKQLQNLKENNIALDTPIIGFEVPKGDNGKLYTKDKTIDTMK